MIICGYAGIGKSWLGKHFANFMDLESTPFEKDFERYYKCIKHYSDQGYVVLTSCHEAIRKLIVERVDSKQRITVFPSVIDKELYKERYIKRGNDANFINIQMEIWEKWTSPKNKINGENLFFMNSGETLNKFIFRMFENNILNKDTFELNN